MGIWPQVSQNVAWVMASKCTLSVVTPALAATHLWSDHARHLQVCCFCNEASCVLHSTDKPPWAPQANQLDSFSHKLCTSYCVKTPQNQSERLKAKLFSTCSTLRGSPDPLTVHTRLKSCKRGIHVWYQQITVNKCVQFHPKKANFKKITENPSGFFHRFQG